MKRQRGMFDYETASKDFYLRFEPSTLLYPRLLLVTQRKLWFGVVSQFGFSIFFLRFYLLKRESAHRCAHEWGRDGGSSLLAEQDADMGPDPRTLGS